MNNNNNKNKTKKEKKKKKTTTTSHHQQQQKQKQKHKRQQQQEVEEENLLPIIIIPGFISSGLEIQQSNYKKSWEGKRIWLNIGSLGMSSLFKNKKNKNNNKNNETTDDKSNNNNNNEDDYDYDGHNNTRTNSGSSSKAVIIDEDSIYRHDILDDIDDDDDDYYHHGDDDDSDDDDHDDDDNDGYNNNAGHNDDDSDDNRPSLLLNRRRSYYYFNHNNNNRPSLMQGLSKKEYIEANEVKSKWLEHMTLCNDMKTERKNIKVRAINGIDGVNYLTNTRITHQLSYVFGPLIDKLKSYGYKENINLDAMPYDWRIPPYQLQYRDKYFTKLKCRIEEMYKCNNNKPIVVLAHSLGVRVVQYFFNYIIDHTTNGNGDGQEWLNKYIHTYMPVAGTALGAPKSIHSTITGDMMALLRTFLTDEEALVLCRSLGSLPWMYPIKLNYYLNTNDNRITNENSENSECTIIDDDDGPDTNTDSSSSSRISISAPITTTCRKEGLLQITSIKFEFKDSQIDSIRGRGGFGRRRRNNNNNNNKSKKKKILPPPLRLCIAYYSYDNNDNNNDDDDDDHNNNDNNGEKTTTATTNKHNNDNKNNSSSKNHADRHHKMVLIKKTEFVRPKEQINDDGLKSIIIDFTEQFAFATLPTFLQGINNNNSSNNNSSSSPSSTSSYPKIQLFLQERGLRKRRESIMKGSKHQRIIHTTCCPFKYLLFSSCRLVDEVIKKKIATTTTSSSSSNANTTRTRRRGRGRHQQHINYKEEEKEEEDNEEEEEEESPQNNNYRTNELKDIVLGKATTIGSSKKISIPKHQMVKISDSKTSDNNDNSSNNNINNNNHYYYEVDMEINLTHECHLIYPVTLRDTNRNAKAILNLKWIPPPSIDSNPITPIAMLSKQHKDDFDNYVASSSSSYTTAANNNNNNNSDCTNNDNNKTAEKARAHDNNNNQNNNNTFPPLYIPIENKDKKNVKYEAMSGYDIIQREGLQHNLDVIKELYDNDPLGLGPRRRSAYDAPPVQRIKVIYGVNIPTPVGAVYRLRPSITLKGKGDKKSKYILDKSARIVSSTNNNNSNDNNHNSSVDEAIASYEINNGIVYETSSTPQLSVEDTPDAQNSKLTECKLNNGEVKNDSNNKVSIDNGKEDNKDLEGKVQSKTATAAIKKCCGDGTVPYWSLQYVKTWKNKCNVVSIEEVDGAEHREVLTNTRFHEILKNYLVHEEWKDLDKQREES